MVIEMPLRLSGSGGLAVNDRSVSPPPASATSLPGANVLADVKYAVRGISSCTARVATEIFSSRPFFVTAYTVEPSPERIASGDAANLEPELPVERESRH